MAKASICGFSTQNLLDYNLIVRRRHARARFSVLRKRGRLFRRLRAEHNVQKETIGVDNHA